MQSQYNYKFNSSSYVFYNKICPGEKVTSHSIPTIKKAYKYDQMCARCGLKEKDHYVYNHSFRPIKSHFCGDDTMNPFDPTPRNVPGYDPMAFHYLPAGGIQLGQRKCNGKICGGRFSPHLD